MKGKGESQEQIYCKASGGYPKRIPYEMYDCSFFKDKLLTNIYDMEQRAWVITSKGKVLPSNEHFQSKIREELAETKDRLPRIDYGFLTGKKII
jgi:hypothetical protein